METLYLLIYYYLHLNFYFKKPFVFENSFRRQTVNFKFMHTFWCKGKIVSATAQQGLHGTHY